jgi:molybdopterin converting factor subunit 1
VRVNVLYFASFRDAAGKERESRELPDGSSVADLWKALQAELPSLRAFTRMPPPAVNRAHVDAETMLAEGDEVAFLPPVAGG